MDGIDKTSREHIFANGDSSILNISQKARKFATSQNLILAKIYTIKVVISKCYLYVSDLADCTVFMKTIFASLIKILNIHSFTNVLEHIGEKKQLCNM